GEETRVESEEDADLVVAQENDGKRLELARGTIVAAVAKQRAPMVTVTPQGQARVLGTRFRLSTDSVTRLEVQEGRVRLTRTSDGRSVEVSAGQIATTEMPVALPIRTALDERFLSLWRDLHDPRNGYFSAEGVPYHAVETMIVDAPDYGHLTTSETFSYWIWLEAMYGRLTGDWSWLGRAWSKMEAVLIPSALEQPTNRFYQPGKPATAVREEERPEQYPVASDPGAPVGEDSLAPELRAAHGTADLYAMHWLADVDNWYGFGRRGEKINTFQRGPRESVWKTIPHPSVERFLWGGPSGFLDLFLRERSYARQWRYTCAPDADARALQAVARAAAWAREQGLDPRTLLPLEKAVRMGDCLRYALREKYFGSTHGLLAWSYAWGGSLDEVGGWAWRTGGSQAHIGYQNPFVAWSLATSPDLQSKSPGGARDWAASLERQLDFYRWLQSEEGALAGGATISGGLTYAPHPVFLDPPSNEWFGWQPWAMERLASYGAASRDPRVRPLVERWVAWIRRVVLLRPDGTYLIPSTLRWSGTPGSLHVEVASTTEDVGVASALARALGAAGETALARELVDRIWTRHRDARGVSNPERPDFSHLTERVPVPEGWSGTLPGGVGIRPGITFLELRPRLRSDPDFGKEEFRYHRFWAQVEFALANAELAHPGR
ncbi:MAG TPA: glycoside hydrolase family 48 protein, partial [Planctomycetota bacterium]|nr:glycoside hydrolase family 48 protein [Planctomycetota bacterium]